MAGKSFLTKIISTIMVLIIAASFVAHTPIHAFEGSTAYKTTIKKLGRDHYELTIAGRKIDEATLTSIWGMLASLDGFEVTRKRIITSFNLNPDDFEYKYINYKDIDLLNSTFSEFFPESNPDKYTTQEKKDMVNIKFFTTFFLAELWKIQRSGTTLYCSMF